MSKQEINLLKTLDALVAAVNSPSFDQLNAQLREELKTLVGAMLEPEEGRVKIFAMEQNPDTSLRCILANPKGPQDAALLLEAAAVALVSIGKSAAQFRECGHPQCVVGDIFNLAAAQLSTDEFSPHAMRKPGERTH